MISRIIITTSLVLSVGNSFAQDKISWNDAIQLLHKNSIGLKQSNLREQISKNSVEIARGSLYPTLYLSANNQHTMGMVFDQVSGKLITGNQWSTYATGSIGTSVILYQGGQKQNELRAENVKFEMTALDSKRMLQELELQLLALFTQTLINHDIWQAGKSQLSLSEQQLHQEEVLVDLGKRTLVDYAQAKAKYANDKFNVVSTKNAYELSLMKLKQLLEIEQSEQIEIFAPDLLLNKQVVPHYKLLNDPYVKILDKQLQLGEIQIKLIRSGYLPTITLNGSYGTNYSSQRQVLVNGDPIPFFDQINQNRSLYGNVSVSMPIFDGFRTKSNIKNAKLSQQSLIYEKEKVIRERKLVISQNTMEYMASQEELYAIQAAYDANKMNYEAINERYKVGKSSSIDLYKSLTELNISEFRLITSRYAVFYKREVLSLVDN